MRVLKAFFVSVGCALLVGGLVQDAATPEAASPGLTVATVSSRADMVSGGDALVEVRPAPVTALRSPIVVKANDRDVSQAFHVDAIRHSWIGLVEGLALGRNTILARAGSQSAQLDVTNYPITGPIVSGEHLKPFVCDTVQSGLGEPLDADCSAATKVEYFYKSKTPATTGRGGQTAAFKPLDASAPRPDDVADTTISTGTTVPYIVRVESGTINRSIYRIAILDDPARSKAVEGRPMHHVGHERFDVRARSAHRIRSKVSRQRRCPVRPGGAQQRHDLAR